MNNLSNAGNHHRTYKSFSRNARRFTFLIILLILLVSPLATVAQAQTKSSPAPKKQTQQNQQNIIQRIGSFIFPPGSSVRAQVRNATPTPTPRAVRQNVRQAQQPNIFQRIWSVITAPFNALVNLVIPQAPKKSPQPAPKPAAPSPAPSPSPFTEVTTETTTAATSVETPVAGGGLTVTSLGAGTKYVDLIGKTIIDSSGNIYPSNDALAQSTKPSLGTSTNKFYGLILHNLEVSSGGFLTTKDKVTLGDEAGDTIQLVGRIGSDIIPSSNDQIVLGESGRAFKSAAITTITNTTLTTTTFNVTTIKVEDGTASAPGLRFTNDTNSGLYRFEADGIALITAGASSNLLSLNSSGNVGIGTTSPIRTLHVVGSGQFTTSILNADGTVSAPGYSFSSDTNTGLWRIGADQLALTTAGSFTSGISINASGNVGIGLTDAYVNLAVRGSAVAEGNVGVGTSTALGAPLQVNGGGVFWPSTTALTGPTNGLAISGNVGIGTSTANNPLTVTGAGVFGINYAGLTAPSRGLIVEGNVGIGISSSANNVLTVGGSSYLGGALTITGATTLSSTLSVTGVTTLSANNAALSFTGTTPSISTSNGSFAVFSSTGNVGIGTSDVGGTLVILSPSGAGTGNVGIGFTTPTANLHILNTGSGLSFRVDDAANDLSPFALNAEGNVGIANSAPSYALDVVGSSRFSTSITQAAGQFLAADGTVSLPSYSFSADTDNGLFRPSTNALTFSTNGVSRLTVTETGNVGVGTTSPGALFVVTAGNVGLGTSAAGARLQVNGNGIFGFSTTTSLTGPTNGLALSGNLGVGTSTASNPLTVTGAGVFGINYGGLTAPSNGLIVEGNVGIGISSSANNVLTVGGSSYLGGALTITGATTLSSTLSVTGVTTLSANNAALSFTGSTPSLTSGASVFGLFAGGNVGIGTSGDVYGGLTVRGGGTGTGIALQTYGSTLTQGLTVLDNGNVGIGTTGPSARFQVNVNTSTPFVVQSGGNVGIGTTIPGSQLTVIGNVGIGTSASGSRLQVNGNGIFGFSTTTSLTGPTNGLAISGNVGIGTSTANSLLAVTGGAVIGAGTGFNAAAPANGLLVQGNVGIGFTTANAPLYVVDPAFPNTPTGATIGLFGSTDGTTTGISIRARGTVTGGLADIGEYIKTEGEVSSYQQGDVLAASKIVSEAATKSQTAYQNDLLGIVTTTASFIAGGAEEGITFDTTGRATNRVVVALAGRVPVKVSLENGPITIGDYLTSSSIPGVAMKAKKAGPILGQALSSFSGETVGTVLTFVKLGYFNGVSLVDENVLGIDTDASQQSFLLLAKLLSEKLTLTSNTKLSNITTDRITAGLEVITPQLTADTVLLRTLKPVKDGNLVLALGKDQLFEVVNELKERVVSIDSLGNAYFKGKVVAAAIKADQIEGLKLLADQVFANKIASLLDFTKTLQATPSSALAQSPTLDTNVVRFDSNGGLTVGVSSEFKAKSIFSDIVEFIAAVIFRGDVSFLGRATFNQDTAGLAVVKSGSDSVDVAFARPYGQIPFVNVTVTTYAGNDGAGNSILVGDLRYVVQNLSGGGFRIKLNKAAPADITFSWTAIAVSSYTVSTGSSGATQPAATTAEASPSPTPSPPPTPSPQPEPTASPTPTPSPSPQPEATSSATISL